jgi:hypothetical protein
MRARSPKFVEHYMDLRLVTVLFVVRPGIDPNRANLQTDALQESDDGGSDYLPYELTGHLTVRNEPAYLRNTY